MKKITLLFFLFLFFLLSFQKPEELQPVGADPYLEYRENEVTSYLLDVSKLKVTTFNLENYLSEEMDVIALYPSIPEVITLKLKEEVFYFNYQSNRANIKRFLKEYETKLKQYGFQKELVKIKYEGVRIQALRVQTREEVLKKLKEQEPLIQYSKR